MNPLSRRSLLQGAGAAVAASVLADARSAQDAADAEPAQSAAPEAPPLQLLHAVKFGMVGGELSILDKFRLLKDIGFDGVELDSPNEFDPHEVLAARDQSGLMIHGVVDAVHWRDRLSDADPNVRLGAIESLKTAIRDAHTYGASSVLLVPGRVADPNTENEAQVWARSIEGIRDALPLAARLGIHICIENVWNGFLYQHDGGDDQTAARLAEYLDTIGSPWVGSYFDLGNHRKYGLVEDWIRTLGRRIVKLDVKDWGKKNGFSRIGDGDVNWPAVRQALRDIGYCGWATAEVEGGDEARLRDIKERMNRVLGAG